MISPLGVRAALDLCVYPGFNFVLGSDRVGDHWLQIACHDGIDNVTGKPMVWKGRKWRLSNYMTVSEVVQTAFLAVMTAIEHEAREKFTYRGQSIFDPHYDVERLVELRRDPTSLSVRP